MMRNRSGYPDRVYYSRWFWRPAHEDPRGSADVFARGVTNVFGRPYCVHAAVSVAEAESIVSAHNDAVRDAVGVD